MISTNRVAASLVVLVAVGMLAPGCRREPAGEPARKRLEDSKQKIQAKWGKSYEQLPELELVAISPHNRNIEIEFEEAFSLHHALEHGKRVKIEWRNVSGGSNAILDFLRKTYQLSAQKSSNIDIAWGGGEDNFIKMANEGILQQMSLPDDYRQNVPAVLGGVMMYDPNGHWAGAAVSSFGFLYNKAILDRLKISPPRTWGDIGDKRFFDLVALADPTKSGSAAAANEMIVQSGKDWPDGWAKLLGILGNAKQFFDGASGAADAVKSVAPVATCIDFYGIQRVWKNPRQLVYVSPAGQTTHTPDPIGILTNPPHPQLAQRFADFVLSRRGQALWALKLGVKDGPVHEPLYRTPIRKDVFTAYQGKLMDGVSNPYQAEQEMKLDTAMWEARYGLLRHLVRAAAIDNTSLLKKAKERLIETGYEAGRLRVFNELPPNIRTREQIGEVADKLRDETQREIIVTGWQEFFRNKYQKVSE